MASFYQQQVKKGTIFITIWCIVNFIQALFTELHFDETYYSLFADHLDWGYFDHPPAIAFWVWTGKQIVGGSLGIRLFSILLLPPTLWLFWKALPLDKRQSDPFFFLLIAASVPYVQITGFVATPDTSLLFAYALLLFAYQAFIKNRGVGETLLLALAMALAMYSKYHAVLFIFLLIGANPRQLLTPKFYIAGVLALALYLPHLCWEYQHDWVSIRYHLFERSRVFDWHNVIEYVWNIPVSYNPLLVIPLIYFWVRIRSSCAFDRTLRVIALGFWIFFFFSTFRGHTQPQWMLPLSFCLIWILYLAGSRNPNAKRVITHLAYISISIVVIARILLVCNFEFTANIGFSQHKKSYTEMAAITEGAPLIFDSNYGMAAHYAWYSGMPAHSQGSVFHRNSQFSILQFDTDFYGKQVWVHCPDSLPQMRLPNRNAVSLKKVKFFIPVTQITIEPMEPVMEAIAGDSVTVVLKVQNPYSFSFPLSQAAGTRLHAVWKTKRGVEIDYVLPDIDSCLTQHGMITFPVTLPAPTHSGVYQLGFSVERPPMKYGFSLPTQKVVVKKSFF